MALDHATQKLLALIKAQETQPKTADDHATQKLIALIKAQETQPKTADEIRRALNASTTSDPSIVSASATSVHMSSDTTPFLNPAPTPSSLSMSSPSTTTPLQSDITPPAIQKQKKTADYIAHLQTEDTSLIPTHTHTAESAAQDHERLSDLTHIRTTPPTSFSSTHLSAADILEMRAFITLGAHLKGKTWSEILPLLHNLKGPLKETVGELLQYREELTEEDVEKIGGLEIGILKLEGAMAIMEVMRMADEDELMCRKARLAAQTQKVDQLVDETVGGLESEMLWPEPINEGAGGDVMNVLQTDQQAMNDVSFDALVDIQHEEERAETAEAELQAQIQRDVEDLKMRTMSEERQLRQDKEERVEAATKNHMEGLTVSDVSQQRQLCREKSPPAAVSSQNDLKASRVSKGLNPMENAKLAVLIPQKKLRAEPTMEEEDEVKAAIEQLEKKAAKLGGKAPQKEQEKKRARSTEDIRSGGKVKKQKL